MGDPRNPPGGPVEGLEEPAAPAPHPGALPNPGAARVYDEQTGAIAKPHRTLYIRPNPNATADFSPAARAPFVPGMTQHPPPTSEEQIETVRRDIAGRVQELEEMLDNPILVAGTRASVEREITRLRELEP